MRVGQCLREHFQRGLPVVRSAGPGVQTVGDGVELVLAEDAEVGAPRQVLADETIGVLAGAALPRAVRVAEVHLHVGLELTPFRGHPILTEKGVVTFPLTFPRKPDGFF